MRLVPVKIYLFFLYVSLPLTPTLRHLFKQLTATLCVCYGGMYGVMCVLYITLPFSAGGKMAAVYAEACAFATNEARAGVC